jgi:hypothetical protein
MIRPAFAAEAPVSRRQPPEGPSHTASGYDTFGDHISYMSAKRASWSPPRPSRRETHLLRHTHGQSSRSRRKRPLPPADRFSQD